MILNKNIEFLINLKGISQTFLSKKIEISVALLNNILKGKSKPTYEVLLKIADYFEVSTDLLLRYDIEQVGIEFNNQLDELEKNNEQMRKEIALLRKEVELAKKEIQNTEKEAELLLREAGIDYKKTTDKKTG